MKERALDQEEGNLNSIPGPSPVAYHFLFTHSALFFHMVFIIT